MPALPPNSRRDWLSRLGALGCLSALGSLGRQALAQPASVSTASAASTTPADYKALVCVTLSGGLDGNHWLLPRDSRLADHRKVREAAGLAHSLDSLLPLNPANGSAALYGLHPALKPLLPWWERQQLALQFNTGTLVQPLERRQRPGLLGQPLPEQLYSHTNQSTVAQQLDTDGHYTGWGWRASRATGAGQRSGLVSLSGQSRLFDGPGLPALVLPSRGRFGLPPAAEQGPAGAARMAALQAMWQGQAGALESEADAQLRQAQTLALGLNPVLLGQHADSRASTTQAFEGLNSDLSQQLLRVARLIEARGVLGRSRPIFQVQQTGYDSHTGQARRLDKLLEDLALALAAFQTAMDGLGLAGQVTAFTLTEFNRTFKPNSGQGTDHGWGNHLLVLGGAVRGGCYGQFPTLQLGGPDDADEQGRWMPTTAWESYTATLARWWGVNPNQLPGVLPGLARVGGTNNLGWLA